MRMNKTTLLELLQESKYNKCNVKIGSKQGSSFWYCGKGNLAFSLPEIKKARQKTLPLIRRVYNNYKTRLKNLDKIYEEAIAKALKKGVKNEIEYTTKMNNRKERERVSIPKKMALIQQDIDTHFLDRPVQELVYGISPDETPCWIIYVKGNERGAYWTIKEYEKRRNANVD